MIQTTLNMHIAVLEKIAGVATALNTSKRDIVVRLLRKTMRDVGRFKHRFRTVKYQPDDAGGNWHCFHICFRDDENEYFVDLRKLCKYSVSHLLAIAVNRYIHELIQNPMNNYTDFCDYYLFHEIVEGIKSWRFYWGYPEKTIERLNNKIVQCS